MKRARYLRLSILAVGISASSCADLTHFNEKRTLAPESGSATMVFIDAKQRGVLAVPGKTETNTTTTQTVSTPASADGKTPATVQTHEKAVTVSGSVLRLCAEPSPDALSAFAASGSANASVKDKVDFAAAFGISEAAGSMGLRTQSIQLMRDAMYRICEGAASGLISSNQFETLQRRFQSSMVAILAIEQLTGAVRGPNVLLAGNANVTGAQALADLSANAAKARKKVTDLSAFAKTKKDATEKAEADLSTFLGGRTPDKITDANEKVSLNTKTKAVDDAKADQKKADDEVTDAKDELGYFEAALSAIRTGDISTSSSAAGAVPPLSPQSTQQVAEAVEHIVQQTLELGFLRETCATMFIASIDGRTTFSPTDTPKDSLALRCSEYFAETVNLVKAGSALQNAAALYVTTMLQQGQPIDPKILELLLKTGSSDAAAAAAPASKPASPR